MSKKLYKINELKEDIQEEIVDSCIRDDERIRDYVKNVLLKDCKFYKDGYLAENGL